MAYGNQDFVPLSLVQAYLKAPPTVQPRDSGINTLGRMENVYGTLAKFDDAAKVQEIADLSQTEDFKTAPLSDKQTTLAEIEASFGNPQTLLDLEQARARAREEAVNKTTDNAAKVLKMAKDSPSVAATIRSSLGLNNIIPDEELLRIKQESSERRSRKSNQGGDGESAGRGFKLEKDILSLVKSVGADEANIMQMEKYGQEIVPLSRLKAAETKGLGSVSAVKEFLQPDPSPTPSVSTPDEGITQKAYDFVKGFGQGLVGNSPTIRVRNRRTGEIRRVTPSEIGR